MTWIKICGTTNLEDALMCAEAGADALGFVFAESPRQVSTDQVAQIIAKLPAALEKVGVFVLPATTDPSFVSRLEQTFEELERITAEAGLTALQLYGAGYNHDWQSRIAKQGLKIIRVFSINQQPEGTLIAFGDKENLFAVVWDSGTKAQPGGTGVVWDWESWPENSGWRPPARFSRMIVAGGLSPQNVGKAIRILHPWGVDVVSGVERAPGKKDPAKVKAFIRAVREADATKQ